MTRFGKIIDKTLNEKQLPERWGRKRDSQTDTPTSKRTNIQSKRQTDRKTGHTTVSLVNRRMRNQPADVYYLFTLIDVGSGSVDAIFISLTLAVGPGTALVYFFVVVCINKTKQNKSPFMCVHI